MVGFWFFNLVSAPLTVIQPMFWLVTGIIMVILALADLFYGVVIVNFVWIGAFATVAYRAILWHYGAYQPRDLVYSMLIAGAFFGMFWLLYKLTRGRGMADGDMYVALYMGLLLGWPRAMVGLLGSFVLGAIVGIFLIVTKLRSRKQTVPFVPFMMVASIITLIWGGQILNWLY
jgi:leader peptidase (prepilin peptidase)/N-methyltransferase